MRLTSRLSWRLWRHFFKTQQSSNIKNLSNHLSNLRTTLISRIFKITFQNRQFSVKSAWEVHRILMFQNDAVWYVLCSSWRDIGVLRARVLVYSDSMPTVVVYLKRPFPGEHCVCIGFQSFDFIIFLIWLIWKVSLKIGGTVDNYSPL